MARKCHIKPQLRRPHADKRVPLHTTRGQGQRLSRRQAAPAAPSSSAHRSAPRRSPHFKDPRIPFARREPVASQPPSPIHRAAATPPRLRANRAPRPPASPRPGPAPRRPPRPGKGPPRPAPPARPSPPLPSPALPCPPAASRSPSGTPPTFAVSSLPSGSGGGGRSLGPAGKAAAAPARGGSRGRPALPARGPPHPPPAPKLRARSRSLAGGRREKALPGGAGSAAEGDGNK